MSNQINNIGSVLLEEYMKGYNIGFSDGFKEGREDAIAEIHSEMSYELAQLEVAGLSETTLRTFAYRIKAITENLLDNGIEALEKMQVYHECKCCCDDGK